MFGPHLAISKHIISTSYRTTTQVIWTQYNSGTVRADTVIGSLLPRRFARDSEQATTRTRINILLYANLGVLVRGDGKGDLRALS